MATYASDAINTNVQMKRGRDFLNQQRHMRTTCHLLRGVAASALPLFFAMAMPAHAQIVTDGTLGPRVNLNGANIVVPPAIGRVSGSNLFHSFATLNVPTGQSINFLGGTQIANIIARITGGSPSYIDGQIGASGGVNLFLLNPSGLLFGPAASLNLTASFYASTGSHLVFSNGARFSSSAESVPEGSFLPFASPVGFLFDGSRAPIALTGTQLVVRNGAALGLFGGDLKMTNSGTRLSILSVLGGTATVVATGGSADVALDGAVLRGVSNGKLEAIGGTIIAVNENASGNGSGRVVIRGGDVFFEKAQVLANSRLGDGRGVEVEASGLLSMTESSILSLTTGKGNAGNIEIRANDLVMKDLSSIDASCDPGCTTGRGGDVNVQVKRNLVMRSDPKLGDQFIGSNSFGGGDTGRVTVSAQNLLMEDASAIQAVALSTGASRGLTVTADTMMLNRGAQIDTSSRGAGSGGALVITAREIILSGDRLTGAKLEDEKKLLSRQSIPSGFFSNAYSSGFAGSVQVNTGNLSVLDGAEISSSSARSATGYGGVVRIVASGDVVVSGVSELGASPKRSAIVSNTFSSGDSGVVEIIADRVRILDRGLIQTQSESSGGAGDVRIRARDMDVLGGQVSSDTRAFGAGGSIDIQLSGTLNIARTDPNAFAGLFARAYSAGPGGSILVRAKSINIFDKGEINAGTIGAGRGGNISIALTERLDLRTGAKISSESDALGDAGDIDIDARGGISVNAAGILTSAKQSDGGNIRLSSGGAIGLSDLARVSAEVKSGTGSGGNVDVAAGTLNLDASTISASSEGGTGGNLSVQASGALNANRSLLAAQVASGIQSGGNIVLSGGSVALRDSRVTANAFSGAGGSIRLSSTGAVLLDRAALSADVASGFGSGGNVSLDGGSMILRGSVVSGNTFSGSGGVLKLNVIGSLLLEQSTISAQVASDEGTGGRVGLSAGSAVLKDSLVSASTFSGGGGSVELDSTGAILIDKTEMSAGVSTGLGSGGNIRVSGASVALRDSNISANTFGGSGGQLQLGAIGGLLVDRSLVSAQVAADTGAGGSIGMTAGSILLRNSIVSASAFAGNGGNMKISSSGTNIVEFSRVSAEVLTGQGDGGNLDVEGGALLLRNSTVSANAYGGRGGNILIDSQNILTNTGSQVTASSELGIDGTVAFSSPAADLSGALFAVSSSFLDAAVTQGGMCAVPRAQGRATLALRLVHEDFGRSEGFLFPAMSTEPNGTAQRLALLSAQVERANTERTWDR